MTGISSFGAGAGGGVGLHEMMVSGWEVWGCWVWVAGTSTSGARNPLPAHCFGNR